MNILIVEDHPITAIGYEVLLKRHYKEVHVHIEHRGTDALAYLSKHDVQLVVLDLLLPKTDTHALLHQIRQGNKNTRVLVASGCSEKVYAQRYIAAGAHGFVHKSADDDTFILAVRTVLSGYAFIPKQTVDDDGAMQKNGCEDPFKRLSTRELEVLNHILCGLSIKQISEIMHLQQSTIATQKSRILEKLGVTSLVDLFHLANLYGMFTNFHQEEWAIIKDVEAATWRVFW